MWRAHLTLSTRLLAGIGAALALAGCPDPEVTRVVDGRLQTGHYISEAAYALYARATMAEAEGDLGGALRAFHGAAAADPESPEAWMRIGAIHCRAAPPGPVPVGAERAFEHARENDASYGPLYRERAKCRAGRGEAQLALEDATRALALDPDAIETGLVYADVLRAVGREDDATSTLRALGLRHPTSSGPWRALLDLAHRRSNATLAREAEGHLAVVDGPRPRTIASVDAALRGGDLREAQRRALAARLADADVAVRAAALGIASLAREQSELVIAADPTDASARIALAAAADLRGDVTSLAGALRDVPRRSTPPSRLACWLFAEVLERRVGKEAALAWLGPALMDGPRSVTEVDPLADATEQRVRAALAVPR